MRWIVDDAKFREIYLRSRTCIYIDSGREPTNLERLTFDDAGVCTPELGNLLQALMKRSGDVTAHYVVLDPDPLYYFHPRFSKYPVIEIAFGDSSSDYLAMLNEDPGSSPADAVGIHWWEFAIVPQSLKWFVHALRSEQNDSGHLWIPLSWLDEVRQLHPYLCQARPFQSTRDRNARAEVVRLAAAVVHDEIDLVEGCYLLVRLFDDAKLRGDSDALVIVGVASETMDIPVGSQRALWDPSALAIKIAGKEAYIAAARLKVLSACQSLIAKLKSGKAY